MNVRGVLTVVLFLTGLSTSQSFLASLPRATGRFSKILNAADDLISPRCFVMSSKNTAQEVEEEDTGNDTSDDDSPLGSLDFVLQNARKRQGMNLPYRFKATWDSPLLRLEKPYPNLKSSVVLTIGDAALILIAIYIGAKGFALGYLIAKATSGPCREIFRPSPSAQIILLPLWPVIWAIGLDQIL